MKFNSFVPDLIIEVTRLCDRACRGCYAPNILKVGNLLSFDSSLFISSEALLHALAKIIACPKLVAIRGGEPSLHPNLDEILTLTSTAAETVVLETHGRWLLEPSKISLKNLSALNVIVKISFDKMHGLSEEDLHLVVNRLEKANIGYMIAVTETTEMECLKVISSVLSWTDESRIIFQKKALFSEDLIKPRLGVIDSKGYLNTKLTTKESTLAQTFSKKLSV